MRASMGSQRLNSILGGGRRGTARPSFANAREAMRSHVCEIVVKPVDGVTLVSACRRAVEQFQIRRRNDELQTQNQTLMDAVAIIGR